MRATPEGSHVVRCAKPRKRHLRSRMQCEGPKGSDDDGLEDSVEEERGGAQQGRNKQLQLEDESSGDCEGVGTHGSGVMQTLRYALRSQARKSKGQGVLQVNGLGSQEWENTPAPSGQQIDGKSANPVMQYNLRSCRRKTNNLAVTKEKGCLGDEVLLRRNDRVPEVFEIQSSSGEEAQGSGFHASGAVLSKSEGIGAPAGAQECRKSPESAICGTARMDRVRLGMADGADAAECTQQRRKKKRQIARIETVKDDEKNSVEDILEVSSADVSPVVKRLRLSSSSDEEVGCQPVQPRSGGVPIHVESKECAVLIPCTGKDSAARVHQIRVL